MSPFARDQELRGRVLSFAEDLTDLIKRSAVEAVGAALEGSSRQPGSASGARPASAGRPEAPVADVDVSFDAYERMALLRAIDESGGDLIAAARALEVGKSTLYRRLKHHGIAPSGAVRLEGGAVEPYVRTDGPVRLRDYERLALERALALCDGSMLEAAKVLRIGKSTMYRLAAKHGL